MLQRKQSIYLLLALVSYVLMFFINIYVLESSDPVLTAKLYAHKILIDLEGTIQITMLILPMILSALLIIGSIITIFLFKDRMLQSKISQFMLLLGTGLLVTMFFSLDKLTELANVQDKPITSYTFGVVFLALPLIFFYLANKAILSDQKMVQEADRLR